MARQSPFDFANSQFEIATVSMTADTKKLLKDLKKALPTAGPKIETKAISIIEKWGIQIEDACRSTVPVWSTQLRDEMFRFDNQAGKGRIYIVASKHTMSYSKPKPGSAQLARFLDAVKQKRSRISKPQHGFEAASSSFSAGWVAEAFAQFKVKKAIWK